MGTRIDMAPSTDAPARTPVPPSDVLRDTPGTVPTASLLDTFRAFTGVVLPVALRGAIVRRQRVTNLAQRLDADRRAVRQMQRLRQRYGPGPLQLRVPVRRLTFVLEPQQVHRVLRESPDPFAIATREKRAALAHFQPEGLLISSPTERSYRRPFNEAVLDTGNPLHRLAEPMSRAVREEGELLLQHVDSTGSLTWDDFAVAWWRAVRRVVLGDGARDDHELTDLLRQLREDGNSSYLTPRRRATRRRFLARLQAHLDRAEPGSLAELVKSTPAHDDTVKHQQVPQWLFALDANAWATYRALALLATHPGSADRARAELDGAPDLPFLRATLLESLRLWPTTPAILRDTTRATRWESGTLAAGSGVVVFAPFFHRDDTRLPEADSFAPELWLRPRTEQDWPLVPFSAGPGMCPGRNVVLLTASTMLATLIGERDWHMTGAPIDPERPLPGTVSPFRLRYTPQRLRQRLAAVS
jgi:cytochrome P450